MAIELTGIDALSGNLYRLDFQDEGANVSFNLAYRPGKGVVISAEFADHFNGRASCREAMRALGRFADGENVTFPVRVRVDGWTGMGT
jgi:hypothetical protein